MTRILDKDGNELKPEDIDYEKGKLVPETITVHHDAVKGVEEVSHVEVLKEYYEMGPDGKPALDKDGNKIVFGKDVKTVIDTPGVEAKDAYDEQEEIQRYTPYTAEELDQKAKDKATAVENDNVDAAEKTFIHMMFATAAVSLSDEQILSVSPIIPEFSDEENYQAGEVVRYGGAVWRALQEVKSKSGYTPDKATSLWKRIGEPDKDGIYPWSQPLGATDAYKKGDKVVFDSDVYESEVDYNVWKPGVYGWKKIAGEGEPTNPPVVEEWPEWKQPTGAQDAYPKGAKVSHNGKHWTSNVDSNVWEPGATGVTQWTEA